MKTDDLIRDFEKTLVRFHLCEKGDRILIAFSGGIDSTALLALFLEIRDAWELDLFLGHFHHMLRSDADEDLKHVQNVAREFSLPLVAEKRDVGAFARKNKANLEESGRKLRYEFLEKAMKKAGASRIATGHTLTDQAETFLIRLLRGSGRRGLAGIFTAVEGQIIRPLLWTEKKDLEVFITEKGMAFREDHSNLDRRFLRNRIRLDLIPFLQENYNPQIVAHLGKTAGLLQDEEILLDELAGKEAASLISWKENHSLDLDRTLSLPRALSRRVVRSFIQRVKGDLSAVTFEDVENMLDVQEGKKVSISGRTVFYRENSRLFLDRSDSECETYHYEWKGKQPLDISETGMRFSMRRMPNKIRSFSFDDKVRVYLDAASISLPLKIRNRKEGDRYRPCGSPGSKKVKGIMREKKIPLRLRDRMPVFLSKDEIIWIKGLPVAEQKKVTPLTKTVLCIESTE